MVYEYNAKARNSIFVERKSKKKRLAAAFVCSCCIYILGIVCLVLDLQGYFTFQEPTIGEPFVTIEGF
jgi:hypothetical protein